MAKNSMMFLSSLIIFFFNIQGSEEIVPAEISSLPSFCASKLRPEDQDGFFGKGSQGSVSDKEEDLEKDYSKPFIKNFCLIEDFSYIRKEEDISYTVREGVMKYLQAKFVWDNRVKEDKATCSTHAESVDKKSRKRKPKHSLEPALESQDDFDDEIVYKWIKWRIRRDKNNAIAKKWRHDKAEALDKEGSEEDFFSTKDSLGVQNKREKRVKIEEKKGKRDEDVRGLDCNRSVLAAQPQESEVKSLNLGSFPATHSVSEIRCGQLTTRMAVGDLGEQSELQEDQNLFNGGLDVEDPRAIFFSEYSNLQAENPGLKKQAHKDRIMILSLKRLLDYPLS